MLTIMENPTTTNNSLGRTNVGLIFPLLTPKKNGPKKVERTCFPWKCIGTLWFQMQQQLKHDSLYLLYNYEMQRRTFANV